MDLKAITFACPKSRRARKIAQMAIFGQFSQFSCYPSKKSTRAHDNPFIPSQNQRARRTPIHPSAGFAGKSSRARARTYLYTRILFENACCFTSKTEIFRKAENARISLFVRYETRVAQGIYL